MTWRPSLDGKAGRKAPRRTANTSMVPTIRLDQSSAGFGPALRTAIARHRCRIRTGAQSGTAVRAAYSSTRAQRSVGQFIPSEC